MSGSLWGEMGGRLGWYELRRGPSRWKDALRMIARTNNGKNKQRQEQTTARTKADSSAALRNDKQRTGNGKNKSKGQYRDSGCARMTTRVCCTPNGSGARAEAEVWGERGEQVELGERD